MQLAIFSRFQSFELEAFDVNSLGLCNVAFQRLMFEAEDFFFRFDGVSFLVYTAARIVRELIHCRSTSIVY